jgi:hypothetical protein
MNEGDNLMSSFQKNGLLIFSRSKEGGSTMFYHLKGIPLKLKFNEKEKVYALVPE